MSHKYKLLYEVEPDPNGVEKEDIPEGKGASDALVIMSIIFPEDGSYSWNMYSWDGRTDKELDNDELWKAWLMLTKSLSMRTGMRPGKRQICENVFNQVMAILKQSPPTDPASFN